MTIPRTSCPNCGHPVVWHGETGENQCKRRDVEGLRCPCQRNMPATNAPRCMKRLALALLLPLAKAGSWLLDGTDKRVCRLSNELSGDDDD